MAYVISSGTLAALWVRLRDDRPDPLDDPTRALDRVGGFLDRRAPRFVFDDVLLLDERAELPRFRSGFIGGARDVLEQVRGAQVIGIRGAFAGQDDGGGVFAMKAAAARIETSDLADLRALREKLGLPSLESALAVVERYIPARLRTPKTQLVLEALFEGGADG